MDDFMRKSIEKKNIIRILSCSIIFSLFITILHNFNISDYLKYFILPCLFLIISFGIVIKLAKTKINKNALFLLIPIFLILLSDIILKVDESNLILNIFILPILLSMFFLSLTNSNYKISRSFLNWLFKLFPKELFNNLNYINDLDIKIIEKDKSKLKNVIKGFFIGFPIAIILLLLLSSADKYFSVFVESISNFFSELLNISHIYSNVIVFALFFIILFSILINVFKYKDESDIDFKHEIINKDIALTVLIIINSVFVLFLISEISKITVNFLSLPVEYTYAEYAREGFFQLLFVTVINFGIILYYIYKTTIINESKLVKYLIIMLISFSILLIINSYYRMFLYIGNYSFTVLRLQVVMFLSMELILFFVILKKIVWKLQSRDAHIFTFVIILIYILNLYLSTQPFINYLNGI